MRLALQIVVAVALRFFLMSPLGWFFEIMHWPTFHSWGLMHAGSFSTWPTLALIAFPLLSLLPWFPRIPVALQMIFFDSQFLMMPWDAVLGYLSFNVLSVTVPITGSAFLGMGTAYAAHRAVRP